MPRCNGYRLELDVAEREQRAAPQVPGVQPYRARARTRTITGVSISQNQLAWRAAYTSYVWRKYIYMCTATGYGCVHRVPQAERTGMYELR